LFKHALVQDVAYGTLLREPRRLLHARIADTLESQFVEIAENQPELLARHCTEAGLIEKAAGFWGKAGQRSLERSALVEAATQLTRAIDQIASLASTPALRREQIKLHVGLVNTLMHTKGHAATETRASLERTRSLIEQAETLGEPAEDPLLLFSTLYGFWVANFVAFNSRIVRELSAQFLTLAEKQGANVPLMIGHRLMAQSLLVTGDIAEARGHYDQVLARYDRAVHGPLATRFGQDILSATLSWRSYALWMLGYPEAALADAERAVTNARAINHSVTLMYALPPASFIYAFCGKYDAAKVVTDQLIALADEIGALYWKAGGRAFRAWLFAFAGKVMDVSELTPYRSTGATTFTPLHLSYFAKAYASIGKFDDARRCISEAITIIETTGERWHEAEVNRLGGEIALLSSGSGAAKAQGCFDRALAIARQQQAKSWELRAAMSMARLWRDQGKPQQARELLAPVYGWFTEGFDTRDLKEAKGLLEELAA
jgi:predicted ATPase